MASHPQTDGQPEVTNWVMESFLKPCGAHTSCMGTVVVPCRIFHQQYYTGQHWVLSILFKCGHPPNFAYVFDDEWIAQDNE